MQFYPESNTKSKISPDFDISVEYANSQATKSTRKDGLKALSFSSNQALKKFKIRLVCNSSSRPKAPSAVSQSPLQQPSTTDAPVHY
jgi:hypothetical protein